MRISKVKLHNYMSFYDEDATDVILGEGVNFVLGKNNSGKTALAMALANLKRNAHTSLHSIRKSMAEPQTKDSTNIEIEYSFPTETLAARYLDQGSPYYIPVPRHLRNSHADDYFRRFFSTDLTLRCFSKNSGISGIAFGTYDDMIVRRDAYDLAGILFRVQGDGKLECEPLIRRNRFTASSALWSPLYEATTNGVYIFNAERSIQAKFSPDENFNLQSDASNLAQVLHSLSNLYPVRMDEYVSLLQRVIPEVEFVRTRVLDGEVRIEIDYYPLSEARPELAIGLTECGTGLSQILAQLYVVFHYKDPKIIIIDEPHSYLHPAAIRELLRIFEENRHHQYILATHSPTAIASVQNKSILLVRRDDNVSSVRSVKVDDNSELEKALEELGSSRSDIFGMDAVIWVEGKTDEICFNLIMNGRIPQGVQIIGLVNTGDLEDKKHAKLAESIYEKLSGSVGILPTTLAFLFDGDKRPDDYVEDENDNGRTCYLKRQNFESYFLDHSGIADILSELINNKDGEPPPKITTPETVQTWMDNNISKENYYPDSAKYDPETWLEYIDGARLLAAMFKALAHQTRKYKKVKDGAEITKRILETEPNHFQEIVDLIQDILNDPTSPNRKTV